METKRYALKEILTICNGKDHSNCSDGVYPVYGSGGIMRYIDVYLFAGESILLPRKGTLSNVQYVSGHFYTVDTCYYTKIDNKVVNPYYLFRLLRSMDLSGLDSGASIPSMTTKTYYGIKVDLPSIDYQNRIAEIIKKYDELIEKNCARIKILEEMAENLYKEWFVRFRFPDHETAEFENGIPKGWEITKLGSVANISTGKSNRQDADENGPFPFFDRSQEIKRSHIWIKDCEGIIVPGEGTSFIPKYYKGKFDLHQRCYCVEPSQSGIGLFLYYVLYLNRHYFLSVATGATVPSLRLNNFLSMKFIMPKSDICRKFHDLVSRMFNQIDYYNKENENLIKQRDLLLPRLMSGKLEV